MSEWHKSWHNIGINDPCWCGRRKKYKHCHLPIEQVDEKGHILRMEKELSAKSFGHEYLYKYYNTKNLEWIAQVLLDNKLYFALPNQLNDPFECRYKADLTGTFEEKRRYFFNKVKAQLRVPGHKARRITDEWLANSEYEDINFWREEERLLIEKARNREFRIFCLTPHPDNLLMWSHYADSHKGICLRFLTRGGFDKALKVTYSSEYPMENFFFGSSLLEQMKSFVLTKSDCWSYEEEFRLWKIGSFDGEHVYTPFNESLLTGVIFGCEIDDATRTELLEIIESRSSPIEVLQAYPSDYDFALEIRLCKTGKHL